jgi:hypothetical protein
MISPCCLCIPLIDFWMPEPIFMKLGTYINGVIKQEVLGRTNHLLSLIRHRPHWKWRVQHFFCCCVCIRYSGNVSTEPLPSNERGNFSEPSRYLVTIMGHTYRHRLMEGFFNYAIEMVSGAMIYVPSFITIGSGVQKLMGGGIQTHARTATWSHKPTLFFQNKESRLKTTPISPCVCVSPYHF